MCAVVVVAGAALLTLWTARRVPYVSRRRVWSIGIFAGPSPLDLKSAPPASNPVLTAADVSDVSALFVADPFMIQSDDTWYMFFEVFNATSWQGDIGVATSRDGLRWTYQQIVLDEPFHLSYPYVFAAGGHYYLVPESGMHAAVRLYEAQAFPTHWVLAATLLDGAPYSDSSIVQHAGRWWLFTTTNPGVDDTLRLYSAERLEGAWSEHPLSPIVSGDQHGARPGGRVSQFGDRLYRYAQDDSPTYGLRVWAFEITELTTSNYRDRRVGDLPIVDASGAGWNARGMHHVDPHPTGDGQWIAAVDGWRKQWMIGFKPWP